MTLASSGEMSIGGSVTNRSINVELGRSATATSNLNETDLRTLAGKASGAIALSDFYGKSNTDVTPNAVNWADINVFGVSTGTNANQTISGINQTITLSVEWTVVAGTLSSFSYRKNSGAYTTMVSGGTFTVVNNDTVNFRVICPNTGYVELSDITVKNTSDGNAVLDTFIALVDDT